jgi:enoyl-CoA hydratase / 3-hydroxyacyl-CoA dehydrogenase
MEKKAPWNLAGTVDEGKLPVIVDRFLGVCLGVAAALVDEGVASIEDTDRGAKIGLRWALGPFEIMNKIGIAKTYEVVQRICRAYPDFKMPAILENQHRQGKPFEFNFVDLEVKNGIAFITLNRPEAMNALNETVVAQIERRFTQAEAEADARAIVFQGAGKAFVAGADIRYFVEKIKAGRIPDIVAFTRKGHELFLRVEESKKLTIALLDGLSLGGGSELAARLPGHRRHPGRFHGLPGDRDRHLPGARRHAAHGATRGAGARQVLRFHRGLHQRGRRALALGIVTQAGRTRRGGRSSSRPWPPGPNRRSTPCARSRESSNPSPRSSTRARSRRFSRARARRARTPSSPEKWSKPSDTRRPWPCGSPMRSSTGRRG